MQSPTRLSSKSIGKNPASTRQHVQFPDQLACERSAYRPAHGPDRYQPPTVKLPAPRLNRVRPDSTKPRLQSATAVVAARWDGDGRGLPNSRNRPAPTTAKMAGVTNAGILVPSRVISAAAPKCPADTATVYTNNERPFMAPKLRLPKYAPRMANPSGASPPDPIPISIADAKTTASPSLTTAQASDSTTPSARADEKPNTAFRMATRSPISPPMSIPTTLAPACTSPASAMTHPSPRARMRAIHAVWTPSVVPVSPATINQKSRPFTASCHLHSDSASVESVAGGVLPG